jgi:hypothetical protein
MAGEADEVFSRTAMKQEAGWRDPLPELPQQCLCLTLQPASLKRKYPVLNIFS